MYLSLDRNQVLTSSLNSDRLGRKIIEVDPFVLYREKEKGIRFFYDSGFSGVNIDISDPEEDDGSEVEVKKETDDEALLFNIEDRFFLYSGKYRGKGFLYGSNIVRYDIFLEKFDIYLSELLHYRSIKKYKEKRLMGERLLMDGVVLYSHKKIGFYVKVGDSFCFLPRSLSNRKGLLGKSESKSIHNIHQVMLANLYGYFKSLDLVSEDRGVYLKKIHLFNVIIKHLLYLYFKNNKFGKNLRYLSILYYFMKSLLSQGLRLSKLINGAPMNNDFLVKANRSSMRDHGGVKLYLLYYIYNLKNSNYLVSNLNYTLVYYWLTKVVVSSYYVINSRTRWSLHSPDVRTVNTVGFKFGNYPKHRKHLVVLAKDNGGSHLQLLRLISCTRYAMSRKLGGWSLNLARDLIVLKYFRSSYHLINRIIETYKIAVIGGVKNPKYNKVLYSWPNLEYKVLGYEKLYRLISLFLEYKLVELLEAYSHFLVNKGVQGGLNDYFKCLKSGNVSLRNEYLAYKVLEFRVLESEDYFRPRNFKSLLYKYNKNLRSKLVAKRKKLSLVSLVKMDTKGKSYLFRHRLRNPFIEYSQTLKFIRTRHYSRKFHYREVISAFLGNKNNKTRVVEKSGAARGLSNIQGNNPGGITVRIKNNWLGSKKRSRIINIKKREEFKGRYNPVKNLRVR